MQTKVRFNDGLKTRFHLILSLFEKHFSIYYSEYNFLLSSKICSTFFRTQLKSFLVKQFLSEAESQNKLEQYVKKTPNPSLISKFEVIKKREAMPLFYLISLVKIHISHHVNRTIGSNGLKTLQDASHLSFGLIEHYLLWNLD